MIGNVVHLPLVYSPLVKHSGIWDPHIPFPSTRGVSTGRAVLKTGSGYFNSLLLIYNANNSNLPDGNI